MKFMLDVEKVTTSFTTVEVEAVTFEEAQNKLAEDLYELKEVSDVWLCRIDSISVTENKED